MIFCKITELPFYKGICANLDNAIDYAMHHSLRDLQLGSTPITGEDGYINRFDYTTKEPDQLLFETHQIFADIHLILEGQEMILTAPVETLNKVEEDINTDYIGSEGKETAVFHMRSDTVLIVFPGEAHKVRCADGCSVLVKKAVVKVRIN